MADPHLPGIYRCLVIMDGVSNLPDDVYVNSWGFRDISAGGSFTSDKVAEGLHTFYESLRTAGFWPSTLVKRPYRIQLYHLGEDVPRTPIRHDKTLGASTGTGTIPEEVCLVGSFYSLKNTPRRRGRLYFGPCATSMQQITNGKTRPQTGVQTTIVNSFKTLVTHANNNGYEWGIISQADANFRRVTHVWCDDAFDTQRRRGPRPTSRVVDVVAQAP